MLHHQRLTLLITAPSQIFLTKKRANFLHLLFNQICFFVNYICEEINLYFNQQDEIGIIKKFFALLHFEAGHYFNCNFPIGNYKNKV